LENLLPDAVGLIPAVLLIVASFFTSALTAAAGVGGGLLMLALMTYLLPVIALIPVHGFVQFGSNFSRSFVQREYIDWPIARQFLYGSLFGAFLGIFVVVQLPEAALKIFLGLFIIAMAWIKFPAIKVVSPKLVIAGGAVTTFISLFAGATGPLVAVFLNSLFDVHRKLVATHGATMTVQHALKLIVFGLAGFAFTEWLPLIAMIILSGFIGTKAGSYLLNKLPEKALKIIFKITLSIVALDLLRRGVLSI